MSVCLAMKHVAVLSFLRLLEDVKMQGSQERLAIRLSGSSGRAPSVVLADRRAERAAMGAKLVRVLPGVRCGDHADLLGELAHLGAIRVTDDPVPVPPSSTRALSQFCRDPRGDVVEVGPASPEQRDLPLALGLAHRLLFRPRRPGREAVEVRHAPTLDAFDDLYLSGRNELVGEPGKLGHLGVSRPVRCEGR